MTRLVTELRAFLARAFMAFRRSRIEAEIDEEIRSHLDMAAEDYLRGGVDPEHARGLALRGFGGVARTKERYRDLCRFQKVEAFFQDAGYGLRALRKSPGFTTVAVAMLALGIGINAAVFTVINATLFEGFPLVHRNDRIVYITTPRMYYPDFEVWRAQAKSFEGMALVRNNFKMLAHDGGAPQTYFVAEVSADTFRVLGVKPILGRDFMRSDDIPGAAPVVILRYELWMRRFGANPAIVGQTVRIDGLPAVVIGVMPRGFSFPTDQDLWLPLVPTPAALRRDTGYARYAFGRLAGDATIESARAEMEVIGRQLSREYHVTNRDLYPVVKSYQEWFIGPDSVMLFRFMWGAVAFVLFMICGQVANLLIERAMGKSRDISIRLALGAGRWRAIRQFLIEILILSVLGGCGGWWIAKVGVRIYTLAQLPHNTASALGYRMDYRVLAYFTAIALGSGLVTGLAAATRLTKLAINSTLKSDSHGIAGGIQKRRLSDIVVSAEMALAIVLLASAAVMIRSFVKLYNADVGVNTANVLSMSLETQPGGEGPERYPTAEAQISFFKNVETRLQALPGVVSVGFGSAVPTEFTPRVAYELADNPAVNEQSRPAAGELIVSTGYFRTLGARVIRGREFNVLDRATTMPVAIVNQRFAIQNWPGESPVGKRLRLFPQGKPMPWLTVVGVVSNIIQNDPTRRKFDPLVYLPFEQRPQQGIWVFVKTGVAPGSLATAVSGQIYAINPELHVPALWSLAERFDRTHYFERNVTVLFLVFAVVSLLLASVGLYAAVSHSVSRRVQEIGIRVAIGATGRDILKLVFRQGLLPVGTGLAIGLAVSFAVNRVLKSQLVGVSPADPVALAAASAVLALSAALGCWIPARRAMRVDPVLALRQE